MKKIIITGTGMKTWKHMAILIESMEVPEMFFQLEEVLKNYEPQNILLDLKKWKGDNINRFLSFHFDGSEIKKETVRTVLPESTYRKISDKILTERKKNDRLL